MVNYQNGKLYKIINTENNDIVYIGSTTQSLSQRYQRHNHKAPNHKIILIENYACNSKEELCMKEQEFIEQNTNLLNKYKAYISEEDYKEYYKKYYEENNKEQKKEYYENNKDKIKEHKKEYYEKNKNEIKEKAKEYYEKNKETINEKSKEKIKCEFCDYLVRKDGIKPHQKSIKCLSFQNVEN